MSLKHLVVFMQLIQITHLFKKVPLNILICVTFLIHRKGVDMALIVNLGTQQQQHLPLLLLLLLLLIRMAIIIRVPIETPLMEERQEIGSQERETQEKEGKQERVEKPETKEILEKIETRESREILEKEIKEE